MTETGSAAVFAQTNAADANELVAFSRDDEGRLGPADHIATGGRGTGVPHLPSQGSVAVVGGGTHVVVVNAGSDDVSLFAVDGVPTLAARVPSGGVRPVSVTAHDSKVYVLNAGDGSISGFELGPDCLEPLRGSARALEGETDAAQIAFAPDGRSLVVTDRASNSIVVFPVDEGLPGEPQTFASSGATPYGFDFAAGGALVVTEAFGGQVGAAAASSYRLDGSALSTVSPSVPNTRSEVCWAVSSKDGSHVWVTNFGDGTISRYDVDADGSLALVDPVAATTVEGEKGVRDATRSVDGRFFYALDADARRVFSYRVEADGRLVALEAVDGLPATVAGLAAL
jgi:6-phosphogluconolactonase